VFVVNKVHIRRSPAAREEVRRTLLRVLGPRCARTDLDPVVFLTHTADRTWGGGSDGGGDGNGDGDVEVEGQQGEAGPSYEVLLSLYTGALSLPSVCFLSAVC
jgi:hypothetical protein